MKTQSRNSLTHAMLASVGLFIALPPAPTQAATNLVTNTSDSGPGSLRAAILAANLSVNVPDFIHFNVVGAGPHTMSPLTPLPALTDPVTIDGYTQSGASANTLASGDNAVLMLVVLGSLVMDTTNSTVRGLAIRQIQVGQAPGPKGGNVIEGCFVGLDASGTNSLVSPGFGVFVQTPSNRIGGTSPAARNLISGKGATGIEIFESFATNNVVQGNFIGTDRSGTKAIGNTDRAVVVNMNASGNIIGGSVPGAGNLISGNLDRGITLDGANNLVQGNSIGTDITGLQPLGNARTGVEIGGPGNTVGGTNSAAANVIAFNGVNGGGFATTNGVDVKLGTTGHAILGNSIFDNQGLGIDVKADQLITAGYPVLTVASNAGVSTVIKGTHTPSTTFRLELFTNPTCDPSGFGEGKSLLTSTNVTTDGGGNFAINWPAPITPGVFLTATANGATEFSQCRMVSTASGTNHWTNSIGGKWEVGSNWSLNVAPFITHPLVLITNAGSKTVNSDATTASSFPGTLTISNLVIGAPTGATNTLLLAHGGTGTPLRILRALTLNDGGALVVNHAALSLEGPSSSPCRLDGALTLNDGWLTVTNNAQFYIGNNGPGSLTVSNGNFRAYYPIVGLNAGANGTWHVAGGTNIVTQVFDIADSLTATGRVVMTGGQLSTPVLYVGLFGNGSLLVSNGTFQCAGQVDVASQPGSRGNFTAAGSGVCTIGSMIVTESSGATGAVLVAGNARVQINGPLDNAGSVSVAGGALTVLGQLSSETAGNSISVSGGQFAVTNDNAFVTQVTVGNGTFLARDVFLGNQKVGIFGVAGGVVALPGSFNGFSVGANGGTGRVWQAGGLINLTNTDLNVGGLFSPAVGLMTISNGVTQARNIFVGGQGDGNGTFTMAGGTLIASNLAVNASSRFIFNQGLVAPRTSAVAGTTPFVVGDGASLAELSLLGGTNAFAAGLRVAANSRLTGSGTIVANVTNLGAISPGASAGRLDITGNLVLSNSSELRIKLGGHIPGTQFDFLRVSGNTTLGGKLSVNLSNHFQSTMTNGAAFTVLTNGTLLTGSFTNVASGGMLTTTDGYARFTVLYAGANTLRLTNLVIVDTDGDGMPDWWEDQFGLSKNSGADAALDLDGDGSSNLNEFRAGTLPDNADSVFRIAAIQPEAGNLRLTWTTVGGRGYRVQTNAPSANGSVTTNFADLSPLISVSGTGESTTNYLHLGGSTNAAARYYRVRLGP